MKSKNFIKLTFLVAVLTFSCTGDFEEINTNPNNPSSTQPNLLLAGVERDVINGVLSETWGIGNVVVQHTAKNQFVNEDRYLWGELNTIWYTVYDNMRDVNHIVSLARESKQANYEGVGLILRSWMFSLATDAYGDIPYAEAIKGKEGVYFPKYDTQEEIYKGILDELEQANAKLAGAINITGDIIYGGDVSKWRKLANSLRLRYLMRISDRMDVSAAMSAILSDPDGHPVFSGNDDHAVYSFTQNAPDQFPLFSSRIGSFNEFRASKTLVDKLSALSDSRLYVFYRPTPETEVTETTSDDEYVGIPNGMDDVSALTYNGGPEFQSRIGSLFYERANTAEGLAVAKGVIMSYPELQFILAEAREKGLITSGTAQEYYERGIAASFDYFGAPVDAGYFAQADVAYSGTTEEKLEKIGIQKWISLYFHGLEAWFDWRRSGYPLLAPSVDNQNDDKIPVRFIYPIIEQSLNADNRAAAVSRQGADDLNSRVWWDVK